MSNYERESESERRIRRDKKWRFIRRVSATNSSGGGGGAVDQVIILLHDNFFVCMFLRQTIIHIVHENKSINHLSHSLLH